MSDLKKSFTNISEIARKRLGITRDEYALCSYIAYRIADPRQRVPGWCCDPKEEIAEFVGVTRAGLYKMASRLIVEDLIEAGGAMPFVWKVTEKWVDTESDCKQSLHESVNKVDTDCKQSLHQTVNKVYTDNKVKRDISKSKLEEERNAGASDPLTPPFKKVDEIYPETFALEAEKEKPLHRGPGAVRVSITDPEFPGVTVVEEIAPGPKTKPTKTGREKQQRNAPNIHPENETVFQHFSDPAKARAAWAEWLQYKYDQHRERYKNAKSELVKLRSLWEETKGDAAQVERNISHSIGNLYRGIFAPKAEKNGTQQPSGLNKATAQHLDLAQYVGQRRMAAMERAMQNGTLANAPEERQF